MAATSLPATRKRPAAQSKQYAWLAHWRRRTGIAEPSRIRGPVTPPRATVEDAVILKAVGEVDIGYYQCSRLSGARNR